MAATCIDNDYVHILKRRILDIRPMHLSELYRLQILNGALKYLVFKRSTGGE